MAKRIPTTLPSTALIRDENLRRIIEALRIDVETLYRERGNRRDSAVLAGELQDAGLIGFSDAGVMYGRTLDTTPPFDATVFNAPPKPVWNGLTVSGTNIVAAWTAPSTYGLWKSTEVWTSATANFASMARLSEVAASTATANVPFTPGTDIFIKIRFTGTNGRIGPFSEVAAHVTDTFDATAGKAIGTHALTETMPDNCIVTYAYYDVGTTFTSLIDLATIALGIATDDATGIKAAIAINDASNPWDAGTGKPTDVDGTAPNYTTQTTAARAVQAVVGIQNLTGGVLTLYLFYKVV